MSDTFTVEGPNGTTIEFPAGTTPDVVKATFAKIAPAPAAPAAPAAAPAAAGYDRNDPRFSEGAQSSAAALEGVPILGAGVRKAGAAISAAAQPITGVGSDGASFADRYVRNLEQEERAKADFEKEHPITAAVAPVVGGSIALGGAGGMSAAAAKWLGMTGKLIPAATRATVSGAGIGAADAVARGSDPVAGAEVGGLTGAGGVVAGKAIGKVWDAARGMFRSAAPPVPARTMRVNETDVPVRESVLSRSPEASETEQSIIHGGRGPQAQEVARAHQEATDAAMGAEHSRFAASLDPSGASPSASPMGAGESIAAEVAATEAERAAAEAARLRSVGAERESLRAAANTSATPGVLADAPRPAAQNVSEALIRARDAVARARDRAYAHLAGIEGEFQPAAFERVGPRIREDLNRGTDPVKITDNLTPNAAEALRDIETNVGQLRFENQAQTPMVRGPDGRPVAPPITATTIDEARKRLISMQRTANSAARKSGDFSDVRAMRRVIDAFDDHVERAAMTPGVFSGDPQELLSSMQNARGLHRSLRQVFGPRNPQDDVGKAIEKIVGKRDVTPAELEAVAPMLFGPEAEPGGQLQTRIARRIIDIFGQDSAEVGALKQGLISHLVDAPAGLEARSLEKQADRIHKFFSGTKGVGLAQTLFSPSERAQLLAHANRLRSAADPAPGNFVEKTIAKWAGRDGGLRASPKQIIDDLMGSTGQKGTAPQLVRHLRDHLSPEAFAKLKQGVFSRITEAADGAIPWKDQKVGNRIANFINGDGKGLADALFTDAERTALKNIGDAHIKLLPVEGTTNPSKSGHVMERLARSAAHGIAPFIGLHAGGLPGVAAALAANKAGSSMINRMAARKAERIFFGDQPRRAASRLPQRFGALAGAVGADQSR